MRVNEVWLLVVRRRVDFFSLPALTSGKDSVGGKALARHVFNHGVNVVAVTMTLRTKTAARVHVCVVLPDLLLREVIQHALSRCKIYAHSVARIHKSYPLSSRKID